MKTSAPFPWRDFIRRVAMIAVPIALQNLMAASAHIVDGLMVEGLGNEHYAAVTQAGRYSFLFQLFLYGAASALPDIRKTRRPGSGRRAGRGGE